MRISDWSSDVCSSDLPASDCRGAQDHRLVDADVGAFEVEAEGLALLHQLAGKLVSPAVVVGSLERAGQLDSAAENLRRVLKHLSRGDRKSTRLNSSH